MKRKTKAQREAEQIEALRMRINDVYSGASGSCWDEEAEWPTAEQLSRIVPALRCIFEGESNKHLFNPHHLDKYETPSRLAEFYFDQGVRA